MLLCELYDPKQVLLYICPIAISLATDRVADVRTIAFKLVSMLGYCVYFTLFKMCKIHSGIRFLQSVALIFTIKISTRIKKGLKKVK